MSSSDSSGGRASVDFVETGKHFENIPEVPQGAGHTRCGSRTVPGICGPVVRLSTGYNHTGVRFFVFVACVARPQAQSRMTLICSRMVSESGTMLRVCR